MTSLTLYIKRTEDFRKWFATIPDDQIQLDTVMEVSAKVEKQWKRWLKQMKVDVRKFMGYAEDISDREVFADLDAGEEELKHLKKGNTRFAVPIKCGSVGCVMGWAEYSYFPTKKIDADVGDYFGTEAYPPEDDNNLFAERKNENLEEKQEALQRLDRRIIQLKALAGLL
jgi:hypothetical protein